MHSSILCPGSSGCTVHHGTVQCYELPVPVRSNAVAQYTPAIILS